MVDARDFVDGYAVRIKNENLEVTKWNLATLKIQENKKGRFLFEGRHWRMDVHVSVVTIDSVMKLYRAEGGIVRYQPITIVA